MEYTRDLRALFRRVCQRLGVHPRTLTSHLQRCIVEGYLSRQNIASALVQHDIMVKGRQELMATAKPRKSTAGAAPEQGPAVPEFSFASDNSEDELLAALQGNATTEQVLDVLDKTNPTTLDTKPTLPDQSLFMSRLQSTVDQVVEAQSALQGLVKELAEAVKSIQDGQISTREKLEAGQQALLMSLRAEIQELKTATRSTVVSAPSTPTPSPAAPSPAPVANLEPAPEKRFPSWGTAAMDWQATKNRLKQLRPQIEGFINKGQIFTAEQIVPALTKNFPGVGDVAKMLQQFRFLVDGKINAVPEDLLNAAFQAYEQQFGA